MTKLITVSSVEMKRVVEQAVGVIGRWKKNTLPVLAQVRLTLFADTLKVQATDLDMLYYNHIVVDSMDTGAVLDVCVEGAQLLGVLKKCKTSLIQLNQKTKTTLEIISNATFGLGCYDTEEFPPAPSCKKKEYGVSLDYSIIPALCFVSPAMSTDLTRYVLNAVCIDMETKALVATDGKRCHISPLESIKWAKGKNLKDRKVIPLEVVNIIRKWWKKEPELVDIEFFNSGSTPNNTMNYAKITTYAMSLIVRLVDGTYPDYKQVVPDTSPCSDYKHIVVERERLISSLEMFPIDKKDVQASIWECVDGSLQISYTPKGQPQTTVSLKVQGDNIKGRLAVNPLYVLDAIKNCECNTITVYFNETENPWVFECGAHKAIIMGMRLD